MGHLQVSASEHAGLDVCAALSSSQSLITYGSCLLAWLQHGAAASRGRACTGEAVS